MRWLTDRTLAHLRGLPDVPTEEGRYEFREEIGRGGMGVVFRAFDRELERDVAIKVLDARVPGLSDRLRQEARILGQLEHPGILPIHDIGTLADGRLFYVMKLVRGERLDQYATRDSSIVNRLRIVDRLCDAVAFAHARGVIHRDLKPENIMIGAFGEVLVLDWGVAKMNARAANSQGPMGEGSKSKSAVGTQHGMVLGTPGYMAPEQAAGAAAQADERADVFAIGGILAYLISDQPPALAAVVARARRADPADRYASVSALSAEVRRFASGLPVEAYREGILERTRRVARRHRTPILLVAAYLLMRIILLFVTGS